MSDGLNLMYDILIKDVENCIKSLNQSKIIHDKVTLDPNECNYMKDILKLKYYGPMSDADNLSHITVLNVHKSKTLHDIGHLTNLEVLVFNS